MAFQVYTVTDPGTPFSFYWGTGNTSGNLGGGWGVGELLHECGKRWSTETWNVKFTVYCDMASHLLVVLQHCCDMVWAHTFVSLQDWPEVVKRFYFDVIHLVLILINNQLDAQFLIYIYIRFSTCFEQPCTHHQES